MKSRQTWSTKHQKEVEELRRQIAHLRSEVDKYRQVADQSRQPSSLDPILLHNVSDAVIAADKSFRITFWNKRAEEKYGWRASEVLGREISEIVEIEFMNTTRERVREEVLTRGIWRGVATHFDRAGKKLIVESSISAIRDNLGHIQGTVTVNRDVMQQQQLKEALRHSEGLFRSVVENLSEGLVLVDGEGTVTYANDRIADFLNTTVEDISGHQIIGVLERRARPGTSHRPPSTSQALAGTFYLELEGEGDASSRWLEVKCTPYHSSEDEPTEGTLCLVADVSERVILIDQLRERDRLLRATADASRKLLTHVNHDEAIDEALAILGTSTAVDRAYVFENHYDEASSELLTSQRFEWTSDRVPAQIDSPLLQNFPLDAVPRWRELLSRGEIVTGLVAKMPVNERLILEGQGIESLLIVPIFLGDEWWGFVGFDACTAQRTWTSNEEAILQTIATSFGGAIKRLEAERELRAARARAEAASHQRSVFLSNMSHEFRSPLAVVLGYADLLRALIDTGEDLSTETTDEALFAIRRSAKRLQALVHNLLDMSRVEEDQVDLFTTELDINVVMRNVLEELRPHAEEKGLDLRHDFFTGHARILGDRARIEEVVMSLLENAIKFTTEGFVAVRTEISRQGDSCNVILEIEDSGIGISESYLPNIFDPFTQESSGSTRAYEGAGIGLTISRRLVELMGGRINVRSSKNHGSTFIVTLPCTGPRPERSHTGVQGALLYLTRETSESLPEVLLLAHKHPIYRLWQHLLQDNCMIRRVETLEDALDELYGGGAGLTLVSIDRLGCFEKASEAAAQIRRDVHGEQLRIVGVLPDGFDQHEESGNFDDLIEQTAPIDRFFEVILKWLPGDSG